MCLSGTTKEQEKDVRYVKLAPMAMREMATRKEFSEFTSATAIR